MSLRRNIQQVFISNFIIILLNTMIYPIILKYYGIESIEFGIYQKYLSTLSVISSFLFLALDSAFISEEKEHKKEEQENYFTINLILIAIGTVVQIIGMKIFKIEIEIIFITLMVILVNLFQSYIILLKDRKDFRISSKVLIYQNIINGILILILGYYYKTYVIFIISNILSNLFGVIYFQIYLKFRLNFDMKWLIEFVKRNKQKIYSQLLINIFNRNTNELPVLIFTKYYSAEELGFYTIGNKLLVMGNRILSNALSQTFLSHMSKSLSEREGILKKFKYLSFLFFLVYYFVSNVAIYFLPLLVGNIAIEISNVIRILVPLLYLSALISPYTGLFLIQNKSKQEVEINIFFSIIKIVIIYFMSSKINFRNILLVYVLIDSIRYFILGGYIFSKNLKVIYHCLIKWLVLTLNIFYYDNLYFKVVSLSIIFYTFRNYYANYRRENREINDKN